MSGKGSRPRNCFSKEFKENYDKIKWKKPKAMIVLDSPYKAVCLSPKFIKLYGDKKK